MNSVPAREVQRILKSRGASGWGELTRRYGRTYRVGGVPRDRHPDLMETITAVGLRSILPIGYNLDPDDPAAIDHFAVPRWDRPHPFPVELGEPIHALQPHS